jgi:hypothetical protein
MTITYKCSRCGITKSVSEFYKSKHEVRGYLSHCKACERKRKLEYYHRNKEICGVRAKTYKRNNRPHLNQYQKNKIQNDLNFRLSRNLRNRVCQSLRNKKKVGSAIKDLGCSVDELRRYLEKQFEPGMLWDNYGKEWHIDHKTPLSWFDLSDKGRFSKACHYTNLQPLWSANNWIKGGRYSG